MVHTSEIMYHTTNKDLVNAILNSFDFDTYQQENLQRQAYNISENGFRVPIACSQAAIKETGSFIKGLKLIKIRHHFTGEYTITIRVEPQKLILGRNTTELFHCSQKNIEQLADIFYSTLAKYIGYKYNNFLELKNWQCKRIDYTKNIKLDSQYEVNILERLTKRTILTKYSSKILYIKDKPATEQSTAQGLNSYKIILYDKKTEIEQEYKGIPKAEKEKLMREADGIIRFEVQCLSPKIYQLVASNKEWTPVSKKFINFLDEKVATNLLRENYRNTVGFGDFYSLKGAIKLINDALLRKSSKERLISFVKGAYKSKNLTSFRNFFIKSTNTNSSKITFKNRIQKLLELNINPIPIPKTLKLDFLKNPMSIDDF